jgi:hypothetical protein
MDPTESVTAADLRRAIDVREGLRAVLLQNNGLPLDEELVKKLDRAVGRAPVRVRFEPGRDPELVASCPGVDGAIARLMAIVAAAVEHGRWERPQGVPARGVRVGLLRQSKNRSGRWLLHGARAATSRGPRPFRGAAARPAPRAAHSSVCTLNRFVPPALPAGRPA